MSGRLMRDAYQKLIDEDIEWLLTQQSTLEREHIKVVLEHSPTREYDYPEDIRLLNLRIKELEQYVNNSGPLYIRKETHEARIKELEETNRLLCRKLDEAQRAYDGEREARKLAESKLRRNGGLGAHLRPQGKSTTAVDDQLEPDEIGEINCLDCGRPTKRVYCRACEEAFDNKGEGAPQITVSFSNGCLWHIDCSANRSPPMKELTADEDNSRTLLECCSCGVQAYYLHGNIGPICVDVIEHDTESGDG